MRTSLELCAGAGGTAIGLEAAGFTPVALVDNDRHACDTLRHNRPSWNVVETDLHDFSAAPYAGVDLLSAGVPCPPFSKAGRQLGRADERDLFPRALELVEEARPKAVLIENVRGLMDTVFAEYRAWVDGRLQNIGYFPQWRLLQAADFGVPQLRPRTVCVALRRDAAIHFRWPEKTVERPVTVGEALYEQIASGGWRRAREWADQANRVAPTLVGGSKKHGGPDLGPTRARREWWELGVDGGIVAAEPPVPAFRGRPALTVAMCATLQGFPKDWHFAGRKTPAYRQVGNAFPPPVALAVACSIRAALDAAASSGAERRAVPA